MLFPQAPFPAIQIHTLDDDVIQLGATSKDARWQWILVYRGSHCPMCKNYLETLEVLMPKLNAARIDVTVVSADARPGAVAMTQQTGLSARVAYGLGINEMNTLGLYISKPRPNERVSHVFPEPAVFVLNGEGEIALVEQSNAPFLRTELAALLDNVVWVRDNNYPIRGTYQAASLTAAGLAASV